MVDESVRNKALEEAMREHEENGFHLERQGDFEAVMVKPKEFSFLWAIVWFLFFGIGILVYIFYYFQQDRWLAAGGRRAPVVVAADVRRLVGESLSGDEAQRGRATQNRSKRPHSRCKGEHRYPRRRNRERRTRHRRYERKLTPA